MTTRTTSIEAIAAPASSAGGPDHLLFWTGVAGVLAALSWIVGDILLVGHLADRAAYPLLFDTYADRVDVRLAEHMAGVTHARLITGALLGVFTMPLYLVGGWHLLHGIRSTGRAWTVLASVLMLLGYALSPLAHAAFYFVGAAYQTLLVTEPPAHSALLALAAEFRRVLMIVWVPAVACQLLGMLVFSLAIATGRSSYPRWFALGANPLLLGVLTIGGPALFGGTVGAALGSAAFNTTWLLVYVQSLLLTRRKTLFPLGR